MDWTITASSCLSYQLKNEIKHYMESDCETRILKGEPITIREFARYILTQLQVKKILGSFYAYRDTVDRLHQLLAATTSADDKGRAVQRISTDLALLKNVELTRIVRTSLPFNAEPGRLKWAFTEASKAFMAERTLDNLEPLCLCLFLLFCDSNVFSEYLLSGKLPHHVQKNSALDNEQELLAVFCLFLWLLLVQKDGEQFIYINTAELKGMNVSESNERFIVLYGRYIQLDSDQAPIRLLFDNYRWTRLQIAGQQEIFHVSDPVMESLLQAQYYPYFTWGHCLNCSRVCLRVYSRCTKESVRFCDDQCLAKYHQDK